VVVPRSTRQPIVGPFAGWAKPEIRLYLTDAYRATIAQSRARGRVIVTVPGRPGVPVPLRATPTCLVARGPAPAPGENMVEIDITLDGRPWRIEVPFRR